MLLIDGVKYKEWEPQTEEEFERERNTLVWCMASHNKKRRG